MASAPFRYRSYDEDSARWLGFRFRPGDIVISTRRRTGTTWMQMICALLIFQRPELPAPLWHLSPWLDHAIAAAATTSTPGSPQQPHRRFIKTHTPLDGIPLDPRVTYIVTGRHPLDMFVSLRHQIDNIDRARMRRRPATPRRPSRASRCATACCAGSTTTAVPAPYPESLPKVMWHLSDAWARRAEPNVLLVHYDDLSADLDGQMRGIAWRLGIAVPEQPLAGAGRGGHVRADARPRGRLVPAGHGMFRDTASFFRRGTSGAGRELLSDAEIAAYHARVARLAPPDMLTWLHTPSTVAGWTLRRRVRKPTPTRLGNCAQGARSGVPQPGTLRTVARILSGWPGGLRAARGSRPCRVHVPAGRATVRKVPVPGCPNRAPCAQLRGSCRALAGLGRRGAGCRARLGARGKVRIPPVAWL